MTSIPPDDYRVSGVGKTHGEEVSGTTSAPTPSPAVRDEISGAEQTRVQTGYQVPAEQPLLPAPRATQGLGAAADGSQIQKFALEASDSAAQADYLAAYNDAFADALDNWRSPPLTAQQRKLLNFYHYNRQALPQDQTWAKVIAEAEKQALETARNQVNMPPDWTPPVPHPRLFANVFSSALEQAFTEALGDGLTAENATRLELAFYHPELATQESLDELDRLGIQKMVNEILDEAGFATPEDWKPSSEYVDRMATIDYDHEFSSALSDFTRAHQLSDSDVQKIQLLHFHPEMELTLPSNVMQAFNQIENTALEAVRRMYGTKAALPTGWLAPDSAQFDGMICANYRFFNERNLSKVVSEKGLTAEQIALLRRAMENPTDATIPAEIRTQAKAILDLSASQIKEAYGLPNKDIITGPALWRPESNHLLGAIQTLSDTRDVLNNYAKNLPPGPDAEVLKNYVKILGNAILAYQRQLYAQESSDARKASDLTSSVSESQMTRIHEHEKAVKEQEEKQAEMERQERKSGVIGQVMEVITPIAIVLSIAASLAMGPAPAMAMVAITALTAAEQATGNKEITKWSLNVFSSVLGLIAREAGLSDEGVAMVEGSAKIITVIIMLAIARKYDFSSAASLNVIGTYFAATNPTTDMLVAGGVDQEKAMWIGMGIGIGVQLSAAMGAGVMNASAANKAKNIKQLTDDINAISTQIKASTSTMEKAYLYANLYLKNIALQTIRGVRTPIDGAVTAIRVGTGGVQLANAFVQRAYLELQGEFANIKAKADAADVNYEDLIQSLRAIINRLMEILNQTTNYVSDCGKLAPKVTEGALISFDGVLGRG